MKQRRIAKQNEEREKNEEGREKANNRVLQSKHLKNSQVVDITNTRFVQDNKEILNYEPQDLQSLENDIRFNLDNCKETTITQKILNNSFDIDSDLNDVMSMIYSSLVIGNYDPKMPSYHLIEDMIIRDSDYSSLSNPISIKTLMFICQVYLDNTEIFSKNSEF